MGGCHRAHARELAHKEWFTITETAAMDSVPLVCKLMFQNESALLESANIDHDELADRLMAIIGMNAVEEHELAGNLELAYVVAMVQPCYRCTWGKPHTLMMVAYPQKAIGPRAPRIDRRRATSALLHHRAVILESAHSPARLCHTIAPWYRRAAGIREPHATWCRGGSPLRPHRRVA